MHTLRLAVSLNPWMLAGRAWPYVVYVLRPNAAPMSSQSSRNETLRRERERAGGEQWHEKLNLFGWSLYLLSRLSQPNRTFSDATSTSSVKTGWQNFWVSHAVLPNFATAFDRTRKTLWSHHLFILRTLGLRWFGKIEGRLNPDQNLSQYLSRTTPIHLSSTQADMCMGNKIHN